MFTVLQSASLVSGLLPETFFTVACPSYGDICQSSISTCSHSLVFGQSEVLHNISRGLVNVLIGCLAGWMISGGAVCLSVLIGTGLEYAKIGLSGYEKTYKQICHLTLSQVSELMADSIAKANRLTVLQANIVLGHRVMRLQLNLLMGLPGFMDMALDVLHTNLETGVPQNDGIRQLAGQVLIGLRDKIRTSLKDDFRALGAEEYTYLDWHDSGGC
ncbi:hypothetical protein WJX77_006658 [Trebouxia sp. C0004]